MGTKVARVGKHLVRNICERFGFNPLSNCEALKSLLHAPRATFIHRFLYFLGIMVWDGLVVSVLVYHMGDRCSIPGQVIPHFENGSQACGIKDLRADWLAQSQNNVSGWGDIPSCGLSLQRASTITAQRVFV